MDNAEIMWEYFKSKGFSDCGIAGLLGNLYAESGFIPTNLQNSYESKLSMTDAQYTAAVDNGTYTNFVRDSAGYGIAQWTYWSRKQNLLNYSKEQGKSIGDLSMQLDFLYKELTTSYTSLVQILKTSTSVLDASTVVLLQFEKPASVLKEGQAKQDTISKRASYAQAQYDRFVKQEVINTMSNSSLATYTRITSNKTTLSSKTINRISIHCFVGQVTAQRGVDYFATTDRQASANYVVGYDGSIGLSVDEKDRSWCTSSADNDKQAITIEVASETTDPYKVTDAAYNALLDLVTDICQRNGKTKVIWNSNKSQALAYSPASNEVILTVHRWFANKACPGDYLYNKHGEIAATVTGRLIGASAEEDEDMTQEKFNEMMTAWLEEQAKKDATFEQDALIWMQQNGIMAGDDQGRMMPKKPTTRGEFSVMLKRYHEKFNK